MKLVTALAAALFAASLSFSATIHVPADQPTIQAGIDAAVNGDTVLVSPGTYVENIDFSGKRIILMSSDGAFATTVVAANSMAAVVSATNSEPHGTELASFTITGGRPGVRCDGSSLAILHNRISGNLGGVCGDNCSAGIDLKRTSRCLIRGNLIHGNAGGYGGAIHVGDDGDSNTNDTICYNLIYDNEGAGDIRTLGIVNGLSVYNNTFDVKSYSALLHQASGQVDFRNNIIVGAPAYGIQDASPTPDQVFTSYNCFYENQNDASFAIVGPGNLREDPLFVDRIEHDYALQRVSPCINAGDPNPTFADPDGTRSDIGALYRPQWPIAEDILVSPVDRTHVISPNPTIAWKFQSTPGLLQQSYNIEVGTDLDWSLAELWQTDAVVSSDTFALYAGALLEQGVTYQGRIRLEDSTGWGKWTEFSFHLNSIPAVPDQASPISNHVAGATPTLWVHNATDAEGDALSYDFAGFHDTDCVSGPTIELLSVPSGTDSTGGQVTTPLAENCRYWWMARAFDGYEYGDWSPYATFWVNGVQEPPSAPAMQFPPGPEGLPVFDMRPTFRWQHSFDPDPHDTVMYTIELSLNSIFQGAVQYDAATLDSLELPDSLEFATRYWWRVKAMDRTGLWTQSVPSRSFWTWVLGDLNHDHTCDIADLSRIVDFLFFGAEISPLFVGDINGSCNVDISDLTRMIDYLFFDGPAPKVGC